MMKVTIHQPEFLPWLGFFDKMDQADLMVILDNVQYRHRYYQNRNRIRGAQGEIWIIVPVHSHGSDNKIFQILIDESKSWQRKAIGSIERAYSRTPFFESYFYRIKDCMTRDSDSLLNLNMGLIKVMAEAFGITTEMMYATDISPEGQKGELILDICVKTGAASYLSGISGKDYLDHESFRKAGIGLEFQEFYHPVYKQLYQPFLPCMSAVDLLFNHGEKSIEFLRSQNVERLTTLFE